MNLLFYLVLWLLLTLLQTVLLPLFPIFRFMYDLQIPLVLFLGLFRPLRESIVAVVIIALVMDGLSGGPFGLYCTTYFWLFGLVTGLVGIFHVRNRLLLPFVVVFGVAFENAVGWLVRALGTASLAAPPGSGRVVALQMGWAAVTGPPILLWMDWLTRRWEQWISARQAKRDG
jgi:rod shape-determining protein MreD